MTLIWSFLLCSGVTFEYGAPKKCDFCQKWPFLVIFWPFLAPKAPNRSETASQAPYYHLGRRRRPNQRFWVKKAFFELKNGHFWPFLAKNDHFWSFFDHFWRRRRQIALIWRRRRHEAILGAAGAQIDEKEAKNSFFGPNQLCKRRRRAASRAQGRAP